MALSQVRIAENNMANTVTVLAIPKLYRWIEGSVAPIVNMWNWGGIRVAPTVPIEHNEVDIHMMEGT
jgi:hypothetical protein